MAEFIAKLGLDAKDFVAGMENAAAKAGMIGKAMTDSAKDSDKLAAGLKTAGTEADGLAKSTKEIDANLQKAGAGGGALDGLTAKFKEGQSAAAAGGGMFGEVASKLGQLATPAGAATAAIGALTAGIATSIKVGQEFEQNLAGVSAITGVTGAGLDDIGNRARDLALKFGGDASTQLQSFQGLLSKFGAQLADTPDKLGEVSENVNILAKAGGLDAAGAMDSLTASMLQFGVDTSNANEVASESGRFINVLAASAKVGAAEIPQVAEAVKVAGVAAKGAKVSFEETNAAIQVLATGGKVGAEAGTALRNVISKLGEGRFLPKDTQQELTAAGVNITKLSDTSITLAERLEELKKIQSDAALTTKLFGAENASAANILISGTPTIKDFTQQITGTSEATVQAKTNMNTLSGQLDRAKAAFMDVGLSVYQVLGPALTFVIKSIMDVAEAVGTILVGAFNLVATPIKAILAPITLVGEKLGIFKALMASIEPVLSVIGVAVGAFTLAMNANAIAAGISQAATAAWTFITGGATAATTAVTGAITLMNAAILANPIAAAVAALAALAYGIYLAYENIEPFRNAVDNLWKLIKDSVVAAFDAMGKALATAWEYIKMGVRFVVDLFMKFNPLVVLFQMAYEKLGFFRTAVDWVVAAIKDMIKWVTDAYDAVVKFFSATDQDVKVTAKVETKPEETKKQIEDAAKKDPPKVEAKADPEAAKKASKALMDLKKDELASSIAGLKTEQQTLENKIKQQAIDERRKLTDDERLTILNSQLKLNKDIEQATRRVYQVTGEGANIKVGLKLSAEESAALKNDLIGQIDRLGEEKIKLGLELVKLSDEQKKAIADRIKQEAAEINDGLKDVLTLKTFTDDSALGTTGMTKSFANILRISSDIKQLRDKANEAAAVGDDALAKELIKRADETQDKLDAIQREAAAKRLEDRKKEEAKAEEQRKKNLEMTLNAIEDETARSLAMRISKLNEERNAILKSTDGTEAERVAIAKRYKNEIDALRSGISEQVEKDRIALARDEQDLKKSLALKKISYEEYSKALVDIDKRKAAIDEQVTKNKAAAEIAIKATKIDSTKENKNIVYEISSEGGEKLAKDTLDTFNKMTAAGKNAGDAIKDTFQSLRDSISRSFDDISEKAADALDFKKGGILDNAEELGKVLSSSFVRAENEGMNFNDSIKESVKGAQTAISVALNKRLADETAGYEKAKEAGTASYTEVADMALTTFALQVNEGEDALKAAAKVAIQAAGNLLDIYAYPAILSFVSFLGPFAIPAATAAISLLKSGLSSLASGFQDGGYTGDGGTSSIAGVVHGQEFVHTADVTRRNRPLFEHLHRGGELSTWMVTTAGALQSPAVTAPSVSTYGIESRLDRLEMAIIKGNRKFESMRAVQMTVQHDPTLTIKTQSRNLEIRSARA